MRYFKGKCVLLTGGSSGIGLAAARILRAAGAHLILVARDHEKLATAQRELSQIVVRGAELSTLSLDVSDRAGVEAAMATLQRPVDVLINNAGVVMPGNFVDLPIDEFAREMDTNYLGAVYLTKALVPSMAARGSGHIAFVSSLGGLMGIWGYSAYAPTKFALRGLAEVLRCEMKPKGIRVSICYPPDTDTRMYHGERPHLPAETKAIAASAGLMSAEAVATALLRGMAAGRFDIVPGIPSKFADIMNRLLPRVVRAVFDTTAKRGGASRA